VLTQKYVKRLVEIICSYGDKYIQKYLNARYLKELYFIKREELRDDLWEALKFFFRCTLFQGRRDEVSMEVYKRVVEILEKKVKQEVNLIDVKSELRRNIGKGKVGKGRDVDLVMDTLQRFKNKNLVSYSINKISLKRIRELYEELRRIRGVGQKTASLFLRDLVYLFRLEDKVSERDVVYLQPIDTWVRKGLEKLLKLKGSEEELKKKVAKVLRKYSISVRDSIKFNMGLWYIGSHAYDLLISSILTQACSEQNF